MAPNDESPFTPRSPFVLKRSNLTVDGAGRLGQDLNHTWVFTSPLRLMGCSLPRCWDTSGTLRTARHLRVRVRATPDAPWVTAFEDRNLPAEAPLELKWAPVAATVARLEVLAVHEVAGNGRSMALRGEVVPFALLQGLREHFEWRALPSTQAKPGKVNERDWAPQVRRVGAPRAADDARPDIHTLSRPWIRLDASLRRPVLQHLGWDSEVGGRGADNLLQSVIPMHELRENCPGSGPLAFAYDGRYGPWQCGGGTAEPGPDRIAYRNVQIGGAMNADLTWELDDDGLTLEVVARIPREAVLLECEAWRFLWDHTAAITAVLADLHQPLEPGARGRCRFPAVWHAPNYGNLAVELLDGDPDHTFLKVDTFRNQSRAWVGLEVGVEPLKDGDVRLIPGTHKARVRFRPVQVAPTGETAHPGLRRFWASGFGFRPEFWGLSNNAGSVNCLFTLHQAADLAAATPDPLPGLKALEMVRFSTEAMLRDGPGYGYKRSAFTDSDSSILIAACVAARGLPDGDAWLRRVWPWIEAAVGRLLAARNEAGLIVSSGYTGNSGEREWSSNWWDVITFGHLDAYVNALGGRALKVIGEAAARLGQTAQAATWSTAAERLRAAYLPCFLNPQTGWLAGWRSADGQLHDYGFLFINGIATAFGLVTPEQARPMLERLEKLRQETGYRFFHLGLPGNLIPIRHEDTPHESGEDLRREDGLDVREHYQSCGASLSMAYHYVRALGLCGFPVAEQIGAAMLDSLEAGGPVAGLHQGVDWRNWDGTPCGYEGLLTDQIYVLLAIQQNRGQAAPLLA